MAQGGVYRVRAFIASEDRVPSFYIPPASLFRRLPDVDSQNSTNESQYRPFRSPVEDDAEFVGYANDEIWTPLGADDLKASSKLDSPIALSKAPIHSNHPAPTASTLKRKRPPPTSSNTDPLSHVPRHRILEGTIGTESLPSPSTDWSGKDKSPNLSVGQQSLLSPNHPARRRSQLPPVPPSAQALENAQWPSTRKSSRLKQSSVKALDSQAQTTKRKADGSKSKLAAEGHCDIQAFQRVRKERAIPGTSFVRPATEHTVADDTIVMDIESSSEDQPRFGRKSTSAKHVEEQKRADQMKRRQLQIMDLIKSNDAIPGVDQPLFLQGGQDLETEDQDSIVDTTVLCGQLPHSMVNSSKHLNPDNLAISSVNSSKSSLPAYPITGQAISDFHVSPAQHLRQFPSNSFASDNHDEEDFDHPAPSNAQILPSSLVKPLWRDKDKQRVLDETGKGILLQPIFIEEAARSGIQYIEASEMEQVAKDPEVDTSLMAKFFPTPDIASFSDLPQHAYGHWIIPIWGESPSDTSPPSWLTLSNCHTLNWTEYRLHLFLEQLIKIHTNRAIGRLWFSIVAQPKLERIRIWCRTKVALVLRSGLDTLQDWSMKEGEQECWFRGRKLAWCDQDCRIAFIA